MNKLEQYLNLASRAYYSGSPIINDDQFDRLAESIGYNAVGAKQHGNVERHVYQMYSLQKYSSIIEYQCHHYIIPAFLFSFLMLLTGI